jgi:GntR family transcriptional repressor for pyruvate dehydrogenase complex
MTLSNDRTAASLEPLDRRDRETVVTTITRRLVSYLLAGDFTPGQRIPSERKLAEGLGVGRSVVREALKSLTLLGLVEVRQGDGTYLKSPDSSLLPQAIEWGLMLGVKRTKDFVEARQHLEVVLAGLAAERATDEDVAELHRLLEVMRAAGAARDAQRFVDADVAFHFRVAASARNDALSDILTSIRSLLQVWVTRVIEAADDFGPSYVEHVPVLEAIEAKDPDAARAAMEAHMRAASGRLFLTVEDDPATSVIPADA